MTSFLLRDDARPRLHPLTLLCLTTFAACSLLVIWAFAHIPFVAIPQGNIDDGLFVRLAGSVLRGAWLGPYDNLTLAKGPFYPIFLAGLARVDLPFLTGQALAYVASAWVLAWGVARATGSTSIAALAGCVVVLDPIMFAAGLLRPTREGVFVPLTMLLGGLLLLWLFAEPRRGTARVALAIVFGLLLAAFWTTREEGAWFVPTLALAWGYRILAGMRRGGRRGGIREGWPVALALVVAAGGVGTVALLIRAFYGSADVVEITQPAFLAGYGALARVSEDRAPPFVAVSRAALARAAAISPLVARLQPTFASAEGRIMADVGCQAHRIVPCDGEIRTGWFMWVLRDAVAAAGGYRNARTARAFYLRMAEEIGAACSDGRLRCSRLRATMVPPFAWRAIPATLAAAAEITRFVAMLDGMSLPGRPVTCAAAHPLAICAQYAAFFHLLGTKLFVLPTYFLHPAEGAAYLRWQAETATLPSAATAERVLRSVARLQALFRRVLPWWLGAAAVAFAGAAGLAIRRARLDGTTAAAAFCLFVAASRVVFLAYVQAVAFPTINVHYLSPAYPFLLLFCMLAPLALTGALAARHGPRAAPPLTPTLSA